MPSWNYWPIGIVLGLAGLVLASWALFADRSRGERRCPKCWYQMKGTGSLRCSECGRTAKHEKTLYRIRRRWRWAAIGLTLIVVGYFLPISSRIRQLGWVGAVPTTLIIFAVDWVDDPRHPLAWELDLHLVNAQMWQWQRELLVRRQKAKLHERSSHAASMLVRLGQPISGDEELRAVLVEALDHEDVFVRTEAIQTLGFALQDSSLAIEIFVPCLRDESQSVRFGAAYGLSRHGSEVQEALPELVEALNDDDENVRLAVAEAICKIAEDPQLGIEVLIEFLAHDNQHLRNAAAEGLRDLGPKSAPAVSALIEATNDSFVWVRLKAIETLGLIGPEAREGILTLKNLVNSEDPVVADAAKRALESIEDR